MNDTITGTVANIFLTDAQLPPQVARLVRPRERLQLEATDGTPAPSTPTATATPKPDRPNVADLLARAERLEAEAEALRHRAAEDAAKARTRRDEAERARDAEFLAAQLAAEGIDPNAPKRLERL